MVSQAAQCIAVFALLADVLTGTEVRQLSFAKIAGYEPGSVVIQHNRVDLDQQEMLIHLEQTPPDFTKAKAIYQIGAHSGAVARLTVNAVPANLAKGAAVSQAGNSAATGYVKKAKGQGATSVDVTYTSTCVDNQASRNYSIAGCYITNGTVTSGGSVNIGEPSIVKNKYRTLAGFSTAASTKMVGQATFKKYKAYHGYPDYGHRYVMAALEGSGIFSKKDTAARVEGAKKGSVYLNVWMYVVREIRHAINFCRAGCVNCNDDPVHAWDEGVAFYAGSLEGTDGSGSGKMLYALADNLCENFVTCAGGTASGVSEVNKQIIDLFTQGKDYLLQGKCSELRSIRDSLIKYMSVPLIQGSLRYAFKVDKLQGGSKEKADGAVFAHAILPLVHSCSAEAATLISKNMKIDSAAPMTDGFADVKTAFESTYSCLGITCGQVGGLILPGTTTYYDGAIPCSDAEPVTSHALDSTGSKTLIGFTAVVNMLGLLAH